MKENHYDIIITGAGMVGAALACALGDQNIKVAVLDYAPAQMSWPDDSFDLRVSAISRSSENVFRNLGAWDGMVARRACAYTDMHVWEGVGEGAIHFDSADVGEPSMGYIIENRIIRAALLERMAQFSNIEFLCPVTIESVALQPERVEVLLQDGRKLTSQLIVGADGGRSQVREVMGVDSIGWPYQQKGVVAVVTTELPHRHTAWQRFLATGPLAFLPLRDGQSSIVWSTTHGEADRLCAMDEDAFCKALGEASEHKLGNILTTTKRAAFPLRLQHIETYIQPRAALIGDAAHIIHPLAGQGANLGFMDAACLAEFIIDARQNGRDLGSLYHLRKYERWRKGANLSMMFSMDGFKRLFSNDSAILSKVRGLGLTMTDKCAPLKLAFMRRAMGMDENLPRLARVVS